jgi:hypothetical protein
MAKQKKIKEDDDQSEKEEKIKISRKTVQSKKKESVKKQSKKGKESNKKKTKNNTKSSANKSNKKKDLDDEDDDKEVDSENSLEAKILPGQKYPTPSKGDPTRAYYESMLKQKPNSEMALKHCIEYGYLTEKEAKEGLLKLSKLDKTKKSNK